MNDKDRTEYIPALKYGWLTPFYDPFIRWTTREMVFKRRLIEQARIESGHRVLDLGCGTATLTMRIKKAHPDAVVTGLDGDPRILEIARAKVSRTGLDITLDHGNGSFDRVLSSLLFHHLTRENKQRTLKEVFRVLRPGGELHMADLGRPHNAFTYTLSLLMQRFEVTYDNIRGLLPGIIQEAGFDRVEATARYTTIFGTICLYRAWKPG
ncbi:MAG: Type 11 methyltransferase [Dehalococcoidia bacterium]|nr:Type 11 methyltransferase [Dehalococcoidia bacterium]